ncbi:acetyl-CoA carboxylase carboxyl transferase subunit beta [Mumia flava]|uniref:Acetyl-CoA carboxylase carboxyl transferase subunit beta n=1 Tax=Mumia flava TaxID=1348852 RepID=A0A2M9B8V5_9ACTN|nr:carboxyl transferase domain-containing protein [Mumia flava]PJJ54382.1 acetyl-CoA carboxylase carboxyl transferase subunit beta [Mumia flava]
MTVRLGAHELVAATVDPGSWESWDVPIVDVDVDDAYAEALRTARAKAGTDESVITGRASLGGHAVALVVSEFRFLGGSIGAATADRIIAAVQRATAERLPLVAATASGGTRMQEGTPAFVRMADITRAVVAHKAAGLPYLVYQRHPTTGGVLASWGSLGHLTVAEPGALIGFLGPGVYRMLRGVPFPTGVQLAENLAAHGVVDAVVEPQDLADVAARALAVLSSRPASVDAQGESAVLPEPDAPTTPAVRRASVGAASHGPDAWAAIETTRRADRPGVRELLRYAAADVVPLDGTPAGGPESAVLTALVDLGGTSCVLVGQDRKAEALGRPLDPAALRRAGRAMELAEELRLPLVCVIDTAGADLSVASEEGGLAGEIAACLARMVALSVPSVSVLLGEGCGGGALALLPAGRVVAGEYAWLSPLPPEGASAILYRTTDRAAEMARRHQIRAVDLAATGIVDAVVPEQPAAHEDPAAYCRAIAAAVVAQLAAQG